MKRGNRSPGFSNGRHRRGIYGCHGNAGSFVEKILNGKGAYVDVNLCNAVAVCEHGFALHGMGIDHRQFNILNDKQPPIMPLMNVPHGNGCPLLR
ncbi:MAG: hypothetical protein R2788_27370 [Saprospiraceae bacterium]